MQRIIAVRLSLMRKSAAISRSIAGATVLGLLGPSTARDVFRWQIHRRRDRCRSFGATLSRAAWPLPDEAA
jgi:hypothetical protein